MQRSFVVILALAITLSSCSGLTAQAIAMPTSSHAPMELEPSATHTPEPTATSTTTASLTQTATVTPTQGPSPTPDPRMIVALSVDDGWIKVAFDSMLDMLAEHNVRATFFLILRAANNLGPERMQRLAAEGHEIGYHSSNHELMTELMLWRSSDWAKDYDLWLEGMRSLLGEEAFKQTIRPYARAPYGLFNAAFLRMTEAKGLMPIAWSVDTGDQASTVRFRHGDIFMLHVSTIEARILEEALSREEIRFGALSEFLPESSPGLVLKRIPLE